MLDYISSYACTFLNESNPIYNISNLKIKLSMNMNCYTFHAKHCYSYCADEVTHFLRKNMTIQNNLFEFQDAEFGIKLYILSRA